MDDTHTHTHTPCAPTGDFFSYFGNGYTPYSNNAGFYTLVS